MSPDGQWVATPFEREMLKEDKNEQRLWMVSTPAAMPFPLPRKEYPSALPRWSPDGNTSFTSARNNAGKNQVWAARPPAVKRKSSRSC